MRDGRDVGSISAHEHQAIRRAVDACELSRELAMPRSLAANKCDRMAKEAMIDLQGRLLPLPTTPTSAESELLLRRAARSGILK